MTALLVDTSAWVEYLRNTDSRACEEVGRLLAGAASEAALLTLEQLTAGLPSLALDPDVDFHAAAAVHRATRRQGLTVRGLVDCLLATVAERHGATLPRLVTVDLR